MAIRGRSAHGRSHASADAALLWHVWRRSAQSGRRAAAHRLPWKYGFKSAKAIVRIRFTDKQPENTWNLSAPQEYGFYANVNPNVDHPRWSQAKERRLGEFFKRPTLMFNG